MANQPERLSGMIPPSSEAHRVLKQRDGALGNFLTDAGFTLLQIDRRLKESSGSTIRRARAIGLLRVTDRPEPTQHLLISYGTPENPEYAVTGTEQITIASGDQQFLANLFKAEPPSERHESWRVNLTERLSDATLFPFQPTTAGTIMKTQHWNPLSLFRRRILAAVSADQALDPKAQAETMTRIMVEFHRGHCDNDFPYNAETKRFLPIN